MRLKKFIIAIFVCIIQIHFAIGLNLADAQSGSDLTLIQGDSQTLEIWLAGDADQNIRAISFNLLADTAGVVNSSNFTVDDLAARWPINNVGDALTANSTQGILIDDAGLATLGSNLGTGVTFTNGDPVRIGTIDISADTLGSTNVTFTEGSNGVLDANGTINGFVTGGRSIIVTAVPEPGAVALLGMLTTVAFLRRRRG